MTEIKKEALNDVFSKEHVDLARAGKNLSNYTDKVYLYKFETDIELSDGELELIAHYINLVATWESRRREKDEF